MKTREFGWNGAADTTLDQLYDAVHRVSVERWIVGTIVVTDIGVPVWVFA